MPSRATSHLMLMRNISLLLAVILPALHVSAQAADGVRDPAARDGVVSYAPLSLFTSGGGRIVPFDDGQMLEIGRRYVMAAVPEAGFTFSNWTLVNVFTFTEYA